MFSAHRSEKAFIFSLKNNDNLEPFKSPILKVESATFGIRGTGAVFGEGMISTNVDLYIAGHPQTQSCYANLGHAYKLPEGYEKGTARAGALLAGNSSFTPDEIEVFYRIKNWELKTACTWSSLLASLTSGAGSFESMKWSEGEAADECYKMVVKMPRKICWVVVVLSIYFVIINET